MGQLINNLEGVEASLYVSPDPFGDYANPTLFPSDFSDEQLGPFAYDQYQITTSYAVRTGVYQMPVCGPVGTPAFFGQVSARWCKKTVRWLASRLGALPRVPHWDAGNSNEVLEFFQINGDAPVLQPNGQTVAYHISGVYVYGLYLPPGDNDDFALPTTAVLRVPGLPFVLAAERFDRSLLRSVQGGAQLRAGG